MDFSFENCIITGHSFPARQMLEMLQYPKAMHIVLLDLLRLGAEIHTLGEEIIETSCLSGQEQEHRGRFTSDKRKREWLAGRLAAKYVAAKALEHTGTENIAPQWSDLEILPDDNGRPFLSLNNETFYSSHYPDISISHSGAIAAAMAASRGRCGIDIQKITAKVVKVCDRFCTPTEKQILQASFTLPARETTLLTKLWAAKEALRKVSNVRSLPGFLELELIGISADPSDNGHGPWKFVFLRKYTKCVVVIALVKDCALALTTMDDIVC